MDRQKLAALVSLAAVALVGGTVFSVHVPEPGVTAEDFADAGIPAANRVATCPARIAPECAERFGIGRYEVLRFPIVRNALADGGVEILLPPRASKCIELLDFDKCDLDNVATYPAIAAKWDHNIPATVVRAASKFVLPDCREDGGYNANGGPVDCDRRTEDGGRRWFGCNVIPRAEAVGAACLDAPGGTVYSGERIEDAL